tara:strand:+ start:1991 stop:2212 length:222 start_codon:yes stop_codon:yes gene_type:complete
MSHGGQRVNAGAPSGTRNGMATVSFEKVEAIRSEWENREESKDRLTRSSLAAREGVSLNTLKNWLQYNSRVES